MSHGMPGSSLVSVLSAFDSIPGDPFTQATTTSSSSWSKGSTLDWKLTGYPSGQALEGIQRVGRAIRTELSWNFVMKQYGDDWRNHRRTFHRFFNQTQVSQYRPVLQEEVFRLLDRLLSSPQVYHEVLHECRLETRSEEDSPSWRKGENRAIETAKERFNTGVQQDQGLNAATKLIADLPPADSPEYRYQEEVARQVTAACYLAGSDTTDSSALALIYALATHPEVQRKAQQEIDLVVGAGRLPDFGDFDQLHYIQAVIKEASRWHSVVPLGVPRVSTCEDDYMGYRIPEKTIILPNTWAILHSSEHFDDPMAFKPERYLKDEYARAGIFSTQALMTMVTSVMACFDIQPPKDEKGQEVPMGPMDVASLTVAYVLLPPYSERPMS
ncbi:cytochrome P450 [Coprinopsis sp. MPI-PUGE-AT-0042]|nr:cytochrome P450 [Coprinopsis sp. MPI-PUGE-AT-0042]